MIAHINLDAHAGAPVAYLNEPWGPGIKRILCIRLDNLGDVLMTTPAIHALRTEEGRHITLLTSRSGALAARYLPDVDEVIEYDAPWVKNDRSSESTPDLAMIERLRAGYFDAAAIFTVYSQSPLPAAMLCLLAGISRRLAHCRENPYALLTDWVRETEPEAGTRHEVERQLALVGAIGARAADQHMRFEVLHQDVASLNLKLAERGVLLDSPFIVMHPGATAASRRYPAERFGEAAAQISDITSWPVLLTGSASEADVCQVAGGAHWMTVNLAGALELGELAALIGHAKVLISNNSGPVHIASALGTPVVDLYALTNPQHTPWQTANRVLHYDVPCRWCYRSVCPEGHHACLNGVAAGQVVAAALELIKNDITPHAEGAPLTAS